MKTFAPVLVSVYTRDSTLRRGIEALLSNKEASKTDLYVVSDAPARDEDRFKVEKVRSYMHSIKGFRSVTLVEHEKNHGQRDSCQQTCLKVLNEYGRIIIIEDDILPSEYFLSYMNQGLDIYEKTPDIFSICAFKDRFTLPKSYPYDAFVLTRHSPWGYGLWKDKFMVADLKPANRYGELKDRYPELFSWCEKHDPSFLKLLHRDSQGLIVAGDVRREYLMMTRNWKCVYPKKTMTVPMDTGAEALHGGFRMMLDDHLAEEPVKDLGKIPLEVNAEIYHKFLQARSPGRFRLFCESIVRNGFLPTLQESSRWLSAQIRR